MGFNSVFKGLNGVLPLILHNFLFLKSNPILQTTYLQIVTTFCRILYIGSVEICTGFGFDTAWISFKEQRMCEITHLLLL
jgi:hypothetical protein